MSGASAAQQLHYLIKMAETLKAIGLPLVLGGDWQISPTQMEATGLPRALCTKIVAPGGATNLHSKRCIDYFLVSWTLLHEGHHVVTRHDASLATHAPVELRLKAKRPRGGGQRLVRPRLLPTNRPFGPIRQAPQVDWGQWPRLDQMRQNDDYDEETAAKAVEEWYAGAERELLIQFDIDEDEQGPYLGMGIEPKVVHSSQQGRYRNTTDEEGLIGHRAAWTCRALQLMITHAAAVHVEGQKSAAGDILARMGHRAAAFYRAWDGEIKKLKQGGSPCDDREMRQHHVDEACKAIKHGLNFVRKLILRVHRSTPWLNIMEAGQYNELIVNAASIRDQITIAAHEVAKDRHHRDLKALRRWARGAAPKLAHRSTKPAETVVRKTASASKYHQGECTAQQAADKGGAEWKRIWRGEAQDGAEEIIRAVEALYDSSIGEGAEEIIALPPLTGDRIKWAGGRMKSDTGVGLDGGRPRHTLYLSNAAREALAQLLMQFEKYKRWPHILRSVIEIARGKKTGGSRLVGLSTTVYRLWARARYADIREVIERRLSRPYLAAAPGRGAAQAVFEQSWEAEAAAAIGEQSATTLVDFEKYYECIEISEVAEGARIAGIPLQIVALACHMYLGPRRISVEKVVSAEIFPRRSILAGCTWATLLIRAIVTKPVDKLQELINERTRSWDVKVNITRFVDDGAFTTRGTLAKVEYIHSWLTRLVLNWVRRVLRKSVAKQKLMCIAGSIDLKKSLKTTTG